MQVSFDCGRLLLKPQFLLQISHIEVDDTRYRLHRSGSILDLWPFKVTAESVPRRFERGLFRGEAPLTKSLCSIRRALTFLMKDGHITADRTGLWYCRCIAFSIIIAAPIPPFFTLSVIDRHPTPPPPISSNEKTTIRAYWLVANYTSSSSSHLWACFKGLRFLCPFSVQCLIKLAMQLDHCWNLSLKYCTSILPSSMSVLVLHHKSVSF